MRKWVLCLVLVLAFPASALAARAQRESTPPVKTQALSCDYICDAGWLGGNSKYFYMWNDVGDVGDADIGALGLSPNKIFGTAWTRFNDGAGSGLDADTIDGANAWTSSNDGSGSGLDADTVDGFSVGNLVAWPVMNSDIRDKSIAMKKIKGLTAKLRALEARIAVLEAR